MYDINLRAFMETNMPPISVDSVDLRNIFNNNYYSFSPNEKILAEDSDSSFVKKYNLKRFYSFSLNRREQKQTILASSGRIINRSNNLISRNYFKAKTLGRRIIILTILILFSTFSINYAQVEPDSVEFHLIETRDGNQYIGEILEENTSSIRLKTENLGEIKILKTEIVKMEPAKKEQLVGLEYWFENPQATRYLWAPNGYGLRKGEGYYQNVWILFNQFAVGVTDYFSLGGGIVPAFLFAGAPTPVWITPKFSIPVTRDKFNIGIGGLAGTLIGEEGSNFGILYGILTFGSRDKNLSMGMGYGYSGGRMAKSPVLNISGMIRIGKRGYFLTENYYIPADNDVVLISLGGRSIINRVGLDYGLFIPFSSGMETFVGIPWLGITVPFGKKY
jgi:hypothetical protein